MVGVTGGQVKDFRQRLGWSQQRLAEALHVSQPTVSGIENGTVALTNRNKLALEQIAREQNVPLPTRGACAFGGRRTRCQTKRRKR